MRKFEKRLF